MGICIKWTFQIKKKKRDLAANVMLWDINFNYINKWINAEFEFVRIERNLKWLLHLVSISFRKIVELV